MLTAAKDPSTSTAKMCCSLNDVIAHCLSKQTSHPSRTGAVFIALSCLVFGLQGCVHGVYNVIAIPSFSGHLPLSPKAARL